MKRYQRTAFPQYLIVGTLILIAIGIGLGSTMIMTNVQFEDYFVIPWAAGRGWLLEGQNPYDPAIIDLARTTLAETEFLGKIPETGVLEQPLVTLFLYLPFSLIPYRYSRAIWMSLQVISVLLIGYISLKISGWKVSNVELFIAIFLILAWLPGSSVVINGQLIPIVLLLIFASILLLINGQDTTAGFFLALTFGSFESTFLIITFLLIWSISRRRWAVLGAYFAGVGFLMAISIILLPNWVLNWFGVLLQRFDQWQTLRTPLMTLSNALPGIAPYLVIVLHVGVLITMLFIWIKKTGKAEKEFVWKILITLVLICLIHIQAKLHHLLFVVPGMFFVFRFWTDRWGLFGRGLSWLFFASIVILPWVNILESIDFSRDLNMPTLLIGYPILVVIGMIWVRWWAVNVPQLPFERE